MNSPEYIQNSFGSRTKSQDDRCRRDFATCAIQHLIEDPFFLHLTIMLRDRLSFA